MEHAPLKRLRPGATRLLTLLILFCASGCGASFRFHPNVAFIPSPLNGLPGAPAISGGAVVSYERELFNGWQMRLVGETTYVGRSRVTFDTTFQAMGGYVRSKLLAEIRRNSLGAQVFITNPTNAFSDTFAFGNPFNPTQTQQVTPQRPLTVGLTLFATY